jgi:hypothetical protein
MLEREDRLLHFHTKKSLFEKDDHESQGSIVIFLFSDSV